MLSVVNLVRDSWKYLTIAILIAWIAQISLSAQADTVEGLYESKVLVTSQSREERTEALRQAFMQVLIRVSGRVDIAQSTDYPNIQEAIELATRYAQQYRYLKYQPKPEEDQDRNLIFWVRFDEAAVTRLLRSNNIAAWGSTRPATLVWLVIDRKGRRELIGNNSQHQAKEFLLQHSRRRGVPLRLPLLDLKDRTALRTSDVWGNFESTIMQASERYQTEAVLVGRVYKGSGNYWNARWSLYSDSRRQDWSIAGADLQEVLFPGIDNTAELLSSRYASVNQAEAGTVLIKVQDIKTLADYNRSLAYLQKLANVSSVQPYYLADNHAIFKLITPQGRLGLARAVALGHTLVSQAPEVTETPIQPQNPTTELDSYKVKPDLVYRLVP
jgi:hypothetical protein